MASALTLLLTGCLLQGALCVFKVIMPQTTQVLRGSCVTIPCSFEVDDQYQRNLDETCKAVWKNDRGTVVFDSSRPQSKTIKGNLTGDLKIKDCTTTLNNIEQSKYFFRMECDRLKYTFHHPKVDITVNDYPPRPTLTPSTLMMTEGSSVSLKCSAPAPCLSHPPTLIWTPSLGDSQETMQEEQDKTKVKTSILTFTASHLHHGQKITCSAVYSKEDGSTEPSVSSLTADISFSPKDTTVSVSPSGPVPEDSIVTLTCKSTANPAVRSYTWYRADAVPSPRQETVVGNGRVLNIIASKVRALFYCETENGLGVGRSNITQIDVQFAPRTLSSDCTQTGDQLNCYCQTVGNPSPTLQWYLDGLPVNQSDKFTFSNESLNDTGLKSILTVTQPQWRDLSTLLCQSSNSLGSASQRFYVYHHEHQTGVHGLAVLLLAVAGVSLSVNVLYTVCVVVLCKARKSVKPKEEDQTYMSLDRRDTSPEYDVIGQTPK